LPTSPPPSCTTWACQSHATWTGLHERTCFAATSPTPGPSRSSRPTSV